MKAWAGLFGLTVLAGCGASPPAPCVTSFSLGVNPATGSADHAAVSPGNQQVFQAVSGETIVSGSCAIPALIVIVPAAWSVSDGVNVQLSGVSPGPSEVATCMGTTTVPATITATYTSGGVTKTATATLTCK